MTPIYDIRRYTDLHERLPRFAEITGRLVQELNLEKSGGRGPRAEAASDRVIRDYVRRRVLSPTERGAESEERGFYTFRHLAEFLAARVLLNDGWPLEKIAERNQASTTEALLALIPGQQTENEALTLARSFRRASQPSYLWARSEPPSRPVSYGSMAESTGPQSGSPTAGEPDIGVDPAAAAARSRASLPSFMRQLTGGEGPPRVRRLSAIEFGDQLTLLIDQRMVERITLADAELIGRTITAALIDYQKLAKSKEPE